MATKEFPNTLLAAITYFSDEDVCRDFLAGLRWPNGVECPYCGSDRVGYLQTRGVWKCKDKDCRRQFSVKKGTIFEDSPIPLSKWLLAIWLYSAGRKGRSSHQLAKDLGVTQKSAWFMSHRIRLALEPKKSHGVKHDDSNSEHGPPMSEDGFKDYVTRLLKVPKDEIDRREAVRKAQIGSNAKGSDTVRKGRTREG